MLGCLRLIWVVCLMLLVGCDVVAFLCIMVLMEAQWLSAFLGVWWESCCYLFGGVGLGFVDGFVV